MLSPCEEEGPSTAVTELEKPLISIAAHGSSAAMPGDRKEELNFAQRPGDKASSQLIAFAGVLGFGAAWAAGSHWQMTGSALAWVFIVLTAAPMIVLNLACNRVNLRASSGLLKIAAPVNWRRCAIKFAGLLFTLGILAVGYWLFPEYLQAKYVPVWNASLPFLVPLLALTFVYFVWVDCRMAAPEDGYWHAGLVVTGQWRTADSGILKEHALGWLVKGFFVPFMLAGFFEHLTILMGHGIDSSEFGYLYSSSMNLIFTIDVTFGAIGYLCTSRILDAHIRWSEPSWLGWVATLICYPPFSPFFHSHFLDYAGKINWMDWLHKHPIPFITWGFVIVGLHVIYVWATISFGCRFSNLTNRGIIAEGPYRFLKHPAYVSKNLAWWLISVPFVAHATWSEALRGCICLGLTNGVYALRAWTEERHLRRDPAYRAYAARVEDNGLSTTFTRWMKNLRTRTSPISAGL